MLYELVHVGRGDVRANSAKLALVWFETSSGQRSKSKAVRSKSGASRGFDLAVGRACEKVNDDDDSSIAAVTTRSRTIGPLQFF